MNTIKFEQLFVGQTIKVSTAGNLVQATITGRITSRNEATRSVRILGDGMEADVHEDLVLQIILNPPFPERTYTLHEIKLAFYDAATWFTLVKEATPDKNWEQLASALKKV